MLMAKVVSDLASRTPGKEAVAMESFAKALMMVGRTMLHVLLNTLVKGRASPFYRPFSSAAHHHR